MIRWDLVIARPAAPLWLRVAAVALAEADGSGVVLLAPGELRRRVDPHGLVAPSTLSRSVRAAERVGLLAPGSTVRTLVLPGGGP